MTTSSALNDVHASTPEYSGVKFATSADGFPVARIGDITLAMLPLKDGSDGGFLASAWRLQHPLRNWSATSSMATKAGLPMKRHSGLAC